MKKHLIFIAVVFCSLLGIIGLSACAPEEPVESTTYKISVTCGENGSYSLSPERESYEENTQVTLTVTPNENFEVETVTVNNQTVTLTNNTYSFAVVSDTNISISFRETNTPVETYKISVSCGENGSYSLSPEQESYEKGTNVELTVTPSAGYVAAVTVNGTAVSLIGGKCSFEVTADMNVSITFNEEKYNVSVNCGQNGTYTISKRGSVNAGEEVTLTVTPYGGYEVDQVLLNGDPVELIDGRYVFTVSGDAAFEITFKVATYDITVNCGEGGSYTLSQEHEIVHNTEVTLAVTTEEGYYSVESVLVNGRRVRLSNGEYSFRVTSDTTIEITLVRIAVKITVDCGEGGSYSLSKENPVAINSEVKLIVVPNDDFIIKEVLLDGEEVELKEGEYNFTFAVTADMKVEIIFEALPGLFDGDVRGMWNPNAGIGVVGESIKLTGSTLTFGGGVYIPAEKAGDDGKEYTFTVTDEDGATQYTVSFEEIYGEKNLLILSFFNKAAAESMKIYYLKDGVDYFTYEAPGGSKWASEVVGTSWSESPEDNGDTYNLPPIEVLPSGVLIGGRQAIVLSLINNQVFSGFPNEILVDGIRYELGGVIDVYGTGYQFLTLKIDGKKYKYIKGAGPVLVKVPQYMGIYTSAQHNSIMIDGQGNFIYSSVQYDLYQITEEGNMHMYMFEMGGNRWYIDFLADVNGKITYLWCRKARKDGTFEEGSFFYTSAYSDVYVGGYILSFHVTGSDPSVATFTHTPEKESYEVGDKVQITVTAAEGRYIRYLWIGNYQEMLREAEGEKSYTFTLEITEDLIEIYGREITITAQTRLDSERMATPKTVAIVMKNEEAILPKETI